MDVAFRDDSTTHITTHTSVVTAKDRLSCGDDSSTVSDRRGQRANKISRDGGTSPDKLRTRVVGVKESDGSTCSCFYV